MRVDFVIHNLWPIQTVATERRRVWTPVDGFGCKLLVGKGSKVWKVVTLVQFLDSFEFIPKFLGDIWTALPEILLLKWVRRNIEKLADGGSIRRRPFWW